MKYTENYENVTKEYDVVIDEERLKEIIEILKKELSTIVTRVTKVSSNTEEEAKKRINAYDMDSIKILSVQSPSELGEGYGHLDAFSKPHNVYECEYSYRQVPELSRLLEDIVINYNTDKDMTDVINEIKEYENSENMEKNSRLYELYIEALSLFKGVLVRETINYDDTEKEQAKRLFK